MFVFSVCPQPVVPILDKTDALFPVHRIYCVGRNYGAHDLEMGGSGRPVPFFFSKPADAVVAIGPKETGRVRYPSATGQLHHEVELVVAIGKRGRDIACEQALDYVYGWAVGVDLTRRDLQAAAKAKGQPWDPAKGFDQSAPISHIRPIERACNMDAVDLWLYVNNRERQKGNTADMIHSVREVIAAASRLWQLEPGDLIFTGSPAGVGPVERGDVVRAGIGGVGVVEFRVD